MNGRLRFNSLSYEHQGNYECVASNRHGIDRKAIKIHFSQQTSLVNYQSLSNRREDVIYSNNQTEENVLQTEKPSKAKLRIQVLSTPSNENTNNPMLKLKCISDLGDPIFEWKYLNGSLPRNVDTSSDILTISPFTQYNSGSYICTAYYPLTNEHAFKIINIQSKFKSTVNLSDKIRVDLISSPYELRRGGNVKIRCSIGKIIFNLKYE